MKIKKIAGVCKARGTAYLWDVTDAEGVVSQWIVTGVSAYPVEGLPYLTEEHIATILDLSGKQMDSMKIQHGPAVGSVSFSDTDDGELLAAEETITVAWAGNTITPFTVRGETWFIDRALLEPIIAEHDDAELYLRRTTGGQPYFAAKAGLLVVGLVWPMAKMEHLADKLLQIGESYREDKDDA